MILLFTDFGWAGPYVGQVKTVLCDGAPGHPVIDLMHDAPAFRPELGAYLLAALTPWAPEHAVILAVIDPGVGTARRGIVVQADDRWYVGPDNGLFEAVIRRAATAQAWEITWTPADLSRSFHGRDLFAPVAARIATGAPVPGTPLDVSEIRRPDWPDDLPAFVYVDGYGNAMTGLRAASLPPGTGVCLDRQTLRCVGTFAEAEVGETFWYVNSLGLVEVAVRNGSAATEHALAPGAQITLAPCRDSSGPA